MRWFVLHFNRNETTVGPRLLTVLTVALGESLLAGCVDLPARELEVGTPQSFNDIGLVLFSCAYTHDWLATVNTRHCALRLTKGTSHTSLEPVGCLVDAYHMERM